LFFRLLAKLQNLWQRLLKCGGDIVVAPFGFMCANHKKDDKDDDIEVLLKIDEPKEEKQEEVKNESIPD
jgi:hypothetical protein